MLNLINKSVKTLNNGISSLVNGITAESAFKTEVDFCKFDVLYLNFLRLTEKEKDLSIVNGNNSFQNESDQNYNEFTVFYIIYSKVNFNLYYISDDFDLKCILKTKLTYHVDAVDSFKSPSINSFFKELPIVALTSNSNSEATSNLVEPKSNVMMKNESCLRFYSIKLKRVIHNLRFKKKILQFSSKEKFFAVSFADGSIKLYENDKKMTNFATVSTNGLPKSMKKFEKTLNKGCLQNEGKNSGNSTGVSKISSSLSSSNFNIKSAKSLNKNDGNSYYIYSVPIFDITDNYILYFNNNNSDNTIDSIEYKNITQKFEGNNINTTHHSKNISSNLGNTTSLLKINSSASSLNSNSNSNNTKFSNYNSENLYKKLNRLKSNHPMPSNLNINIGNNNSSNFNITKIFSPVKTTFNQTTDIHNGMGSIENFANEAYNNISKLKNWSISQIKDLSNLRNASNLKNNSDLKHRQYGNVFSFTNNRETTNKKSCILTLQKIIVEENIPLGKEEREGREKNVSKSDRESREKRENNKLNNEFVEETDYSISCKHEYRINVPFFDDGVSLIKFFNNGKYFMVGNKNSQMFYIYELFPQSNLKYTSDTDSLNINSLSANSIYSFKIIYSLYRGITSASINSVDISSCNNFSVIASNKGTFHLFKLPKRDNQVLENSSTFDYKNFDDINQKVTCGRDFEKIKLGNFLSSYTYKTTCKIVNYSKIDVNQNFSQEMKDNLLKSKFRNTIKGTVLLTYTENDPSIHIYFLNKYFNKQSKNASPYYLIKKLDLSSFVNDEKEQIERNFNELCKKQKVNQVNIHHNINKMKSYYKDHIDIDTTDKNFPNLHTNPLFTFNIIKHKISGKNKIKTGSLNINNGVCTNNNSSTNKLYAIKSKIIEEKNESEMSPKSSVSINKQQLTNKNKASSYLIENTINILLSPSNNQYPQVKKIYYNSLNIKSRSNSISMKMPVNNMINNSFPNTIFVNDVQIHEKLICQDIDYHPLSITPQKSIVPKNDFSNENYLQPKLIVYPSSHYVNHNKLKKNLKFSNSISDNSSSIDNSISLTGINNYDNINTGENEGNNSNAGNNFINNSNGTFYQNKEKMLKSKLKNAIETNIVDSVNKNNEIVKVIGEFTINDNYYVHK